MLAALFIIGWLSCPVVLGISVFQRRWRTYRIGVVTGLVLVACNAVWTAIETYDISLTYAVFFLQVSAVMVFGLSLVTAFALHWLKRRDTA
jgi:hypothetical protein